MIDRKGLENLLEQGQNVILHQIMTLTSEAQLLDEIVTQILREQDDEVLKSFIKEQTRYRDAILKHYGNEWTEMSKEVWGRLSQIDQYEEEEES